jgi:hypothetical protein
MAATDEFQRQRELDTYRVLDTLPEPAYEDIVRLASMLCGTPIALVSLIDRDRQWFKAQHGMEAEQTRRDEAFCDHAIRAPGQLMEVPDATRDARFADNPYVTGNDHVRFYAGMPLVTPGGAAIGTLCVLDREPRQLDDTQRQALGSLARLTMNMLDAHRRELALQRSQALAPAAMPAAPAAPARPDPGALGFGVAIFEVQDLAGQSRRRGQRVVEAQLERVREVLQGALRAGSSDSVNHSTGSAEFIVVLHGNHSASGYQKLQVLLPSLEKETGLHLLSAHAAAATPDERVEMVFLRADEALSQAKDADRAA